jgi:hypothetical protein
MNQNRTWYDYENMKQRAELAETEVETLLNTIKSLEEWLAFERARTVNGICRCLEMARANEAYERGRE